MARCPTCQHRQTDSDGICHACRTKTATRLASLTTQLADIAQAPLNPPTGISEYVSGGTFTSRPPLSIHALSLTATTPVAIIRVITHPTPPTYDASIPIWIISWAAVWRRRNNHHQPSLTTDGHQPTTSSLPADDPVTARWIARFGHYRIPHRVAVDATYLRDWLDYAWTIYQDMSYFVAGLARLAATLRATLGNRSTYLGRCPETADDSVPCGARLVRYGVGEVRCPECGTVTDESGLLWLAQRMRDVWGTSADRQAWA